MDAVTPAGSDTLPHRQHAFLLNQLVAAPGGTLTQAAANKALTTPVQSDLGLQKQAADDLRGTMVAAGWLAAEKAKRVVTYSVTEAGKRRLGELGRYIPLAIVKGKVESPADDAERAARELLVLHAVARAGGRTPVRDDVAAVCKRYGHPLTPATARAVLTDLVTRGHVAVHRSADAESFSITDVGEKYYTDRERSLPLLPAGGAVHRPENDDAQVAREVYVLTALTQAPNHTISKADLEVGFGGKGKPTAADLAATRPDLARFRAQECLHLNPATTRAVLTDLAARGDIRVDRAGDSESYALTPAGVTLLGRLRSRYPVLPPTGKPTATTTESVRRGREAVLLLKLLQSADYALWESDAAAVSYTPLKMNHAAAWAVLDGLAREKHVALHWDGTEGHYTLTEAGKRYLTTIPFDMLGEVKIKGSALTELLTVARGGATPGSGEVSTRAEPQPPRPVLADAQLEAAVTEIYRDLLLGEYARLQMVPIHEIRKRVVERFGAPAVPHAAFNERLLELRRKKVVRLVSIDDRSRATPDQLRDSVFAVGETFFYAENPHASA